jgi:L-asparaginase / beta-aspartyl-peptidase
VPNDYFRTEQRYAEWLAAVERAKQRGEESQSHATVGCVALDTHGNLAAGTSTGGMTNKRWGRIGDTPIIGAGTYANNATCAVSCTGTGEYFIRSSAAFHISALMEFKGLALDAAVRQIIEHILPAETGGIIAVDRAGRISMHFNTLCMYRAATDSTGWLEVALGKVE